MDSVAHTRVKTPTAAAEHLIARMDEAADRLYTLAARLQQAVRGSLVQEHRRIDQLRRRIPAVAYRNLSQSRLALATVRKDIRQAVSTLLDRRRHRLELLSQRIADASPEKQLARGYSLTLKDGRAVRDASALHEGDILETRLHQGSVRSVVRGNPVST